jgi:serine protease Do
MTDWLNENEQENSGNVPESGFSAASNEPTAPVSETPVVPVSEPTPEVSETPVAPASEATSEATPEAAPEAPAPQPPMSHPPYGGYYAPQPPMSRPPYGGYHPQPPYGAQPPAPQPPKKKSNGTKALVAVLAIICCVSLLTTAVLAVQVFSKQSSSGSQTGTQTTTTEETTTQPTTNEQAPTLQISDAQEVNDGGLTTREIVAKNLDSTVVLTMYTKQSSTSYGYYMGYGSTDSDTLVKTSAASGIVMTEDGYIITNSHCVYNSDTKTEYARIDVTMYDGTVYESATIIGYDPSTDLAVIKVDATGLTAAEFGDSSAVEVGDRVVTLGSTQGGSIVMQWSASQGILSGQARDVYEDTGYTIKCLQVDAAINPGSSGGPLLNMYGQVVGINSAKIVLSGYDRLGFSIPINEAKTIIDDLVKYGYVKGRVSLGVAGQSVTSVGYEGYMIQSISSDSSFVGTSVQVGDIITYVDDVRVTDYSTLRAELVKHSVGDTVKLTLLRVNTQTRTTSTIEVSVVLGESTTG